MQQFRYFAALLVLAPTVLPAQQPSGLDAHVHGHGSLNVAIEGNRIAMELAASGADIVGFEHAASSEEDREAIETAIAALARPLDLFGFPSKAECSVNSAHVTLAGVDNDHDDHDDHSSSDGDAHDEEHAEVHDEEHDDEHAEVHDEEHDEEHAAHDEDEASHTEFHAEYELVCSDVASVSQISLTYFDRFPNALELEVQVISDTGAHVVDVERSDPVLDMRAMF